ncbi:zinc finger HIT domain-containing protein [Aspergillus stella-maris]|uniref:zinc finger HIT domain-containing protein n=1 Tax=Aspergillus stella-maris TaxID=1810926 RepID=UPI003CCCBB0B
MASLCEVCIAEPFKYKCPACGLMSCSLACTRTHKIYCAPKPLETPNETTDAQPQAGETTEATGQSTVGPEQHAQNGRDGHNVKPRELSSQIKNLLERYPPLRDQLRDIYQATLEEQWVEGPVRKDRFRHFRGKQQPRTRGPWTREKGFKRGVGKVKKYREECEGGSVLGKGAEGFMQLLTLVNEGTLREPQQSSP